MNTELQSIMYHLEKSGFLKRANAASDAHLNKMYPARVYPHSVGSNGETIFYDKNAPKGQEWSPATPDHRETMRKNMSLPYRAWAWYRDNIKPKPPRYLPVEK